MFNVLRAMSLSIVATLIASSVGWCKEEKVALKDVPAPVKQAVQKRFPGIEVMGAGREDADDGQVVFEMQLQDKQQKIDVSITPEGAIREIEKQIDQAGVPQAVRKAVSEKYPKAKIQFVEQVILVTAGKEVLDCYEFKLAAEGKIREVKIAPDGQVKHEEIDSEGDDGK